MGRTIDHDASHSDRSAARTSYPPESLVPATIQGGSPIQVPTQVECLVKAISGVHNESGNDGDRDLKAIAPRLCVYSIARSRVREENNQ